MTRRTFDFADGDAVLLVDIQADFCPGGALPIVGGDQVVPLANELIGAAEDGRIPVYASRDWHPIGHLSFAGHGGQWPEHCIQDTEGAKFHRDLRLPAATTVISKGVRFDQDQYSAFDETGLDVRLRSDGIRRLWVAGLAQDVCVHATVLGARKLGFEVIVVKGATKPLTPESGSRACEEMVAAGAMLL